jgi:hypothetical protein
MQWDPVWRLYRTLRGLSCDVQQQKVLDIAIDEVLGCCVESFLCYRSIRWPKSILQGSPESKVRICILHIYISVFSLLPRLGEPLAHSLELWSSMCVSAIFP